MDRVFYFMESFEMWLKKPYREYKNVIARYEAIANFTRHTC